MLSLLLMAGSCAILQAQTDDLLLNPNIVWATEFDANFKVTSESLSNFADVRKILEPELVPYNGDTTFLSEKLFRAIRQEGKQVFEDGYLQKPVSGDLDAHCLRVLSGLPEGKRDSLMARVRASNVVWFRAKQRYYLDKKSGTFRMHTLSVAPCVSISPHQIAPPYPTDLIPLFWISVEDGDLSLGSNDVTYSVRFRGRTDLNCYSIPLGKTLKQTFEGSMMTYLFDNIIDKKMKGYFSDDPYSGKSKLQPLNRKTFEERFSTTDTVTIFDPETYEEGSEVVKNTFGPDEIEYIRFAQSWYWDERKNQLSIAVERLMFMRAVREYDNYLYNVLYLLPIFIMLTKG